MPDRKVVENLAVITDSFDQVDTEYRWPGPMLYVPRHLAQEHGIDEHSALMLSHDEGSLFSKCVQLVFVDRQYEHLEVRQIKDALGEIVWDIYVRRPKLRYRRERIRQIRQALDSLARPLGTYRFMFAIDNLKTIESPLTVGAVTFQVLADELVTYWITRRADVDPPALPAEAGTVVAVVEEDGASPARAAERAGAAVDDALDELRLVISRFKIRVWDNQLRFARGDKYVGTLLPDEDTIFTGWRNRDDHPLEFVGPLFRSANEHIDRLSYVRSSDVTPRMREQLLRAIGWIGQSTVRTDPDDKVVDLCTALECLLTTQNDKKKGEAIAIRMMVLAELLQDGFQHPLSALRLYVLRSKVVHGSARHVCTDDDYRNLKSLVTKVLDQVIELLKQDRSITKPSKLVAALSQPDVLEMCISWLGAQPGKLSKDLKVYAESLRDH